MDIFNYDKVTGEYTGRREARPSPLEPGVFLIPAYATEKELPSFGQGEAVIFSEEDWLVVKDMRNTPYYFADGTVGHITEIQGTVPEGASLTKPEVPETDPTKLTKLEFLSLITFDEQVKFEEQAKLDAKIQVVKNQITLADFISLKDPRVAFYVDILIDKGVLLASRKEQILSNTKP
jgi:hypothetical protein